MKSTKVLLFTSVLLSASIAMGACGKTPADGSNYNDNVLNYTIADKSEGIRLMMSNDAYFDGLTQNDLDFRMQKTGASLDEYREYAKAQVLDYTDDQKAIINGHMDRIVKVLADRGYQIPELEQIVFINTTMKEECGSTAYTHGTQIYIDGNALIRLNRQEDSQEYLDYVFSHELFHCMTRCSSDFRSRMYEIIHFTTRDEDYILPPSVRENFITNPDVEHHNSHAVFKINGEPVDCFTAFVTVKHFEKEGDRFQECGTAALVPVDGTDTFLYS